MIDSDKQALIDNTCTVPTKIIVDNGDNTTTVLTESDYVLDWQHEDFRFVPNEGFIGQFVERIVTGNLKNVNDSFSITDKEIEVQFGITTVDNNVETTNWYSLGHFVVSNPSDDNVKDKTSFKAIDYTKYFEKPFVNDLEYPTTLGCLAYSSCHQCNVELGDFTATLTTDVTIDNNKQYFIHDVINGVYNYVPNPTIDDIATYYELSFGFSNADFIIDGNPFTNNESNREVMKCVGKTALSWVRIDWDDKCYIDYTKVDTVDSKDEIDNDHYYDLTTTNSTFGELNTIVVGMKAVDGENVTITDPNTVNPNVSELDVWDNPLTYTQEKREEVITAGSQLFGLKYQGVELTSVAHVWLKGKEKIKIKDMENNYIYTYPFDRTISYNGHVKTKINAPVISVVNTQYKFETTMKNAVRNTQLQVDKANSQITSLVTETTELNDTVTELGTRYTQSLTEFQYQITQLNNTVTQNTENLQEQINDLGSIPEELQNALVTININGISVSTNISKISTLMTNNAFKIMQSDNPNSPLAYFGYDENLGRSVSQMDNLTVTNYLTAGYHRIEKIIGENRTGWFYIGGI